MTDQLREQKTSADIRGSYLRLWAPSGDPEKVAKYGAEFDRWLSAAITEAKAEGKREGWDEGASSRQCHCAAWNEGECSCGMWPSESNPYRTPKGTNNDNR